MGWSGRAPSLSTRKLAGVRKAKEHAIAQKLNAVIAVMGIDIGKNSFDVVGLDARGAIVLRQKWSRSQVETRFANIAIAEAVQRPTLKFVATKTAEQLDLQALHRVRDGWSVSAPALSIRSAPFCWSVGLPCGRGCTSCAGESATILATRSDVLSPRMVHGIEHLAGGWRRLDDRIAGLSAEIEALARLDPGCQRLRSVPGSGPIISSATVAAIGTGDTFGKGRDFAAWLRLVPKQISTGDRTIPGKISKRGNRYRRVLFVQAAWVVLIRSKSWERHGLKPWIEAARKRMHRNVLAIALANQLACIA